MVQFSEIRRFTGKGWSREWELNPRPADFTNKLLELEIVNTGAGFSAHEYHLAHSKGDVFILDADCGDPAPSGDEEEQGQQQCANGDVPLNNGVCGPPAPPPPDPTGTCIYLNAAGTAPDPNGGIDPTSTQSECSANQGAQFFAGVTMNNNWRVTVDPNTGVMNVMLPSQTCAVGGYAVVASSSALSGGALGATKVGAPKLSSWLAVAAALNTALGAYTLLQLCGTGVNAQTTP